MLAHWICTLLRLTLDLVDSQDFVGFPTKLSRWFAKSLTYSPVICVAKVWAEPPRAAAPQHCPAHSSISPSPRQCHTHPHHRCGAPGSCLALGWRPAPPGGAERAAQEDRPGGGGHQALSEVVPLPAGEAVVFSAVRSGRNWVLQGDKGSI